MKLHPAHIRDGFALGAALALAGVAACFDSGSTDLPTTLGTPEATLRDPAGPFAPAASKLRRLTESQFRNAIADVFGSDATVAVPPEPDVLVEGASSVGAGISSYSPRGVENIEATAFDVAKQLTASDAAKARLAPCITTNLDDACLRGIAEKYGRRLWRRDLAVAEIDTLVTLARDAGTRLASPIQSVRFLLSALIQAPDFVYRIEIGSPVEGSPSTLRYSDLELASRLAFFLWDGPPDDALLEAAKRGELASRSGLAATVDRMLADAKARRGLEAFVDEWLHLPALKDLTKDTTLFTSFSTDVGPAARQQILLDLDRLVLEKRGDLRTMFTTRETHVNRKLASLYDVPAPSQTGFALVTLPAETPRMGLLGTVGILGYQAHPTGTSPTKRGAFVMEALLCHTVLPPPADVDTSIPEVTGNRRTMRERLLAHQEVPSCAGCHIPIDNIGLPLEAFDGIGRLRKTDNGAVLDLTGKLDGVPFDGPDQLSELIARHPDFPYCVTKKLHRFAYGHTAKDGEQAELDKLSSAFVASGHRLDALVKDLVLSDNFRIAAAPAAGE
jgi:hypothetical protein